MFPSRMAELPGFPKAPALCSDLQRTFDSIEPSEVDSEDRDRTWQESVV